MIMRRHCLGFLALSFVSAPAFAAEPTPAGPAAVNAEGWRFTVFSDAGFARTINRQAPLNYRVETRSAALGLNIQPIPALSFGLGLTQSESETRFRTGAGSASTEFQAGYGYVQLTGFGFVNLTATAGLGRSDTSLSRPDAPLVPGAVSGYDGRSSFASVGVSAFIPLTSVLVVPAARISWSNGRSGGFVDSLGLPGSPVSDRAMHAEIGVQAYLGVPLGEFSLVPYGGLFHQHEFELPTGIRQRATTSLLAGLSANWKDLVLVVEGRTLVGRSDYEAHRLRATLSYRF
jgi:hypothetical protein